MVWDQQIPESSTELKVCNHEPMPCLLWPMVNNMEPESTPGKKMVRDFHLEFELSQVLHDTLLVDSG